MAEDIVRQTGAGSRKIELLVIGGSAGGLAMALNIIPRFRKGMELAVLIVFHRKQSEDTTLIDVLASRTSFAVKEADDKDVIRPGVIYVAPADYHVLIEKDKTITLDDSEKVNYSRPSIDVTFETAADVYGTALACLLLSGSNADGVEGLVRARTSGALILVQDPASAEVPYMPQMALKQVKADLLLGSHNLDVFSALLM